MDKLVANAWKQLSRIYFDEICDLIKVENEQEAPCETGCCGLPLPDGRRRLHEKAVYALNQAIAWGTSRPGLFQSLYWHYHYLGQFDLGEGACRKALELDGLLV